MMTGKRIGDVAICTGLSVHALRQWHRRYNIGPTYNSQGGQRRYSDSDVERIELIQKLRQHGYSLPILADWPLAKLRQQAESRHHPLVVGWHGPSFSAMAAQTPQADLLEMTSLDSAPQGMDLGVYECPTITEDLIDALPEHNSPVHLWYDFANRKQLSKLEDLGVQLHRGRPTAGWLLQTIRRITGATLGYSLEELTQLANMEPELDCECPNHLAGILRELTSFAQYSLECVVNTPEDAELHQSVYESVKDAQRQVLSALQSVLAAENLLTGFEMTTEGHRHQE
ncbi:MAG: MerR family transcriptional regulator [Saccharospirillum sp.]